MIERAHPDLPLRTFELRPGAWDVPAPPPSPPMVGRAHNRTGGVRSRSAPASAPVTHRVRFGGPLATPLRVDDVHDDPDLVTFMREETAGWQLVHSAVTFSTDGEDRELETAIVQLELSGAAEALAWSMLPESASTPIEVAGGFSIGPQLKLAPAEAGASVNRSKTRHGEEAYLRADGLLTPKPAWRFKRTRTVKLDGAYRLVMIVRAPSGTSARLAVALSGSERAGRFLRPLRRNKDLLAAAGPTIELQF